MSKRSVKAIYGMVEVEDDRGLRISIDDGPGRRVSIPITRAAAKELSELLAAFALVSDIGE
jgi:hypothetical protein